jgi:hypothetical protein
VPDFASPHDTAVASSGTKLFLGASQYTVTNIAIAFTNPGAGANNQIDVAHLGQTTGELAGRMNPPLTVPADDGGSGRQVTFDYIGSVVISDASTGTYRISVAGTTAFLGGSAASYYTVSSSSLTLATNDAIRGQAVITIAR